VKGPVVKTVKARLGCHQGHTGLAARTARTFNRGERGLAFRHDAPLKWRRTTPSASTARADDRKYLDKRFPESELEAVSTPIGIDRFKSRPLAGPQNSFSAVDGVEQPSRQKRTSGAPGSHVRGAGRLFGNGQALQSPADRYRERRLEPPQAADLQ